MCAIDVACRKMIEKFGRTVVPFDPWRSVISVPHQRAAELEWSFPCEAKALLQRLELAARLVTVMVDVETGSRIEYEPEHIDSTRELGMITTSAGDGQEMKTHFHDLREFAMVSMPAGHADTLSERIAVVAWRNREKQTSTPESPCINDSSTVPVGHIRMRKRLAAFRRCNVPFAQHRRTQRHFFARRSSPRK